MREGYKQTDLGEIPESWEVLSFDEIFQFVKTKSLSRAQLNYEEGQYNYIHYGDIHSTFKFPVVDVTSERLPLINSEIDLGDSVELLKDGDLIIADASEDLEGVALAIELKNVNNLKVIGGLHTIVCRDNSNKTINGIRTYLLRSYKVAKSIKRIANGANVLGISKGNLIKIKLVLPTIREQQKIAEILSTVDEKIEVIEERITQTLELKKGLMQQLLTKGIGHTEFKESPLGEIPMSWEVVKLKDQCTFTQGVQIPHSEQIEAQKDGYIRYLYIRDYFSDSSPCYVEDKYPEKIMHNNDIMMVNTGNTSGKVYSGKYGVLSNNAFKIAFDYEFIDRDFILHFLKSNFLMKHLKTLYNHGGQPHVGHKNVGNVPIALPLISEQQEIAEILSSVDEKLEVLSTKKDNYQELKQGLMQQLLTGKIRVNHLIEKEMSA